MQGLNDLLGDLARAARCLRKATIRLKGYRLPGFQPLKMNWAQPALGLWRWIDLNPR